MKLFYLLSCFVIMGSLHWSSGYTQANAEPLLKFKSKMNMKIQDLSTRDFRNCILHSEEKYFECEVITHRTIKTNCKVLRNNRKKCDSVDNQEHYMLIAPLNIDNTNNCSIDNNSILKNVELLTLKNDEYSKALNIGTCDSECFKNIGNFKANNPMRFEFELKDGCTYYGDFEDMSLKFFLRKMF